MQLTESSVSCPSLICHVCLGECSCSSDLCGKSNVFIAHAASWGKFYRDAVADRVLDCSIYHPVVCLCVLYALLTCAQDPGSETTYQLARDFIEEFSEVFPDQYFHLGADELNTLCWELVCNDCITNLY